MQKLVLQMVIRQWDKSQLSDQHKQARQALPDRYPISTSAVALSGNRVLLDQYGDELSGNRIRYQLTNDNSFLIDRFRFDLNTQTVEFKPKLRADEPPLLLTTINEGWIQCHYQWRYRVEEGGFIFWLYENVILNASFVEAIDAAVFMSSPPEQRFETMLAD